MKSFVTGANGFMGSALVRALLANGQSVKALVRKDSDLRNLEPLDVEIVQGDITDRESLRRAMQGCSTVYHVAAMVYFWVPPAQLGEFTRVNVEGSKNVFSVARELGVEKVVYTSTVSAIGSYGRENPTTEEHSFNMWDMSMEYERSKYSAEFEAWRFAARGLPLVAVLPTAPLGAGDIKPNPIGKLILDVLSRKVPGYMVGGGNFIDVDDVARGHLLAAQKGAVGERYILANENLSTLEFFQLLEQVSGVPAPRLKVPVKGALALAHLLQFVSDRITGKHPLATPSLVKFSSQYYFVDGGKARRELGFEPRFSVAQAASKAIAWFLDHGYLKLGQGKQDRIRERLEAAPAKLSPGT